MDKLVCAVPGIERVGEECADSLKLGKAARFPDVFYALAGAELGFFKVRQVVIPFHKHALLQFGTVRLMHKPCHGVMVKLGIVVGCETVIVVKNAAVLDLLGGHVLPENMGLIDFQIDDQGAERFQVIGAVMLLFRHAPVPGAAQIIGAAQGAVIRTQIPVEIFPHVVYLMSEAFHFQGVLHGFFEDRDGSSGPDVKLVIILKPGLEGSENLLAGRCIQIDFRIQSPECHIAEIDRFLVVGFKLHIESVHDIPVMVHAPCCQLGSVFFNAGLFNPLIIHQNKHDNTPPCLQKEYDQQTF